MLLDLKGNYVRSWTTEHQETQYYSMFFYFNIVQRSELVILLCANRRKRDVTEGLSQKAETGGAASENKTLQSNIHTQQSAVFVRTFKVCYSISITAIITEIAQDEECLCVAVDVRMR